jgi:hypothetical protein
MAPRGPAISTIGLYGGKIDHVHGHVHGHGNVDDYDHGHVHVGMNEDFGFFLVMGGELTDKGMENVDVSVEASVDEFLTWLL